jgi:nicotinate phosphoribosyltransferase
MFSEFGTRRAFSPDWQERVVRALKEEVSPAQFVGTSNTYLAMKYDLLPMGTAAHELYMVIAALMDNDAEGHGVRASLSVVNQQWWDTFGYALSIALPDTFGTAAFLREFTPAQARAWKGFRQDSGDPNAIIRDGYIPFFRECGLSEEEIRTKLIIPSDGLELRSISHLVRDFGNAVKISSGWGSNLTNDLGFSTLSIVVKVAEAAGRGTVKLSDNPAKAMGRPEDIARYMRIFGYKPEEHVRMECTY